MKHPLEWLYALLAVAGLVGPWSCNIRWMQTAEATGGAQFVADAMANHASSSIAVDIVFVSVCFFIWMLVEARRVGMKHAWLFIPYALLGAVASAFPLFLLLRSRRMRWTSTVREVRFDNVVNTP